MSLINKVLDDLSQRQVSKEIGDLNALQSMGVKPTQASAPQNRATVTRAASPDLRFGLGVAIALLLGVGMWQGWMPSLPLQAVPELLASLGVPAEVLRPVQRVLSTAVSKPTPPVSSIDQPIDAAPDHAPVVPVEPATVVTLEPEIFPSVVPVADETTVLPVVPLPAVVGEVAAHKALPQPAMALPPLSPESQRPTLQSVPDTTSRMDPGSAEGSVVPNPPPVAPPVVLATLGDLAPAFRLDTRLTHVSRVVRKSRIAKPQAKPKKAAQSKVPPILEGQMDTAETSLLRARAALIQGDLLTTNQMLRETPQTLHNTVNYLTILAAWQQQSGAFEQAVQSYRRLIKLEPERGSWWLGVGISLERLGRLRESYIAYLEAETCGDLDAPVRRFVQERLVNLGYAGGHP